MDKKLLAAACLHVGAELDRVIDYAVYDDRIAMVVNNGVKGCPKYVVPLVELSIAEAVEPEPSEVAIVAINATAGALKLAEKERLDLAGMIGTGRSGKITVADVHQVLEGVLEEEE